MHANPITRKSLNNLRFGKLHFVFGEFLNDNITEIITLVKRSQKIVVLPKCLTELLLPDDTLKIPGDHILLLVSCTPL